MKAEELITLARKASEAAYAPYSKYHVGAALLGADGRVFTGCNVENASYGLTNCAERTALFKAVSEGCRTFTALAVVTRDGGTMCGACRQVVAEFAPDIPVYHADTNGRFQMTSTRLLLPSAFDGRQLKSTED